MNPQIFNSFRYLTKSAIADATGLGVPAEGLGFPPCAVDDLPHVLRGRAAGGALDRDGFVGGVSCLDRDGRSVDLRWASTLPLGRRTNTRAPALRMAHKNRASGWYAAM